jgi:hypothetical protein
MKQIKERGRSLGCMREQVEKVINKLRMDCLQQVANREFSVQREGGDGGRLHAKLKYVSLHGK